MQIDTETVVFAVLAVLFIGALWSRLGTRNDNDPQRENPFARQQKESKDDEIFALAQEQQPQRRLPPVILPPNSLAGRLAQIKAIDSSFDEKAFLREMRDVFSAIVGAYAAGNLTLVRDYLSAGVMTSFQASVEARRREGQTATTHIARLKEAEVIAARAKGTVATLTVRFVSDQENILRDAQGKVIGGAEGHYEEVTDLWTFSRDAQATDSRWALIETRA